jgi:hypothetical protein
VWLKASQRSWRDILWARKQLIKMDRGWQKLLNSPAGHNNYYKLELSRAWEPSNNSRPLPDDEGEAPMVVFLMETKLWKVKMDLIIYKLGFTNLLVVDCVEKSGGLALLWGDKITVDIQNYSHRHINGVIKTHIAEVQ